MIDLIKCFFTGAATIALLVIFVVGIKVLASITFIAVTLFTVLIVILCLLVGLLVLSEFDHL